MRKAVRSGEAVQRLDAGDAVFHKPLVGVGRDAERGQRQHSLRGALGRFGPQTGERAAFLLQCGQGSQRPRDQFRAGVAVGRKRAEEAMAVVSASGAVPVSAKPPPSGFGLGDAFRRAIPGVFCAASPSREARAAMLDRDQRPWPKYAETPRFPRSPQ